MHLVIFCDEIACAILLSSLFLESTAEAVFDTIFQWSLARLCTTMKTAARTNLNQQVPLPLLRYQLPKGEAPPTSTERIKKVLFSLTPFWQALVRINQTVCSGRRLSAWNGSLSYEGLLKTCCCLEPNATMKKQVSDWLPNHFFWPN